MARRGRRENKRAFLENILEKEEKEEDAAQLWPVITDQVIENTEATPSFSSRTSSMTDSHTRRTSRKHPSEDDIGLRRARGENVAGNKLYLLAEHGIHGISASNSSATKNYLAAPAFDEDVPPYVRMVAYRLVKVADTSQLHTKITEMGQRIRQLEDALAIFHSSISNEPHPLLRDELLAIKFGPEKNTPLQSPSRDDSMNSIDALGTLTIGDKGESKYFGSSAGSEIMFLAGAELGLQDDESSSTFASPSDVARLFPMSTEMCSEKLMDTLFSYLPDQPRAWALCETYLEQAAWAFQPMRRDEIIDELLTPVYRALKAKTSEADQSSDMETLSPHKLSALYIVFSLGALVDMTLEPFNAEAEKYFELSRAALSLRNVFDSPEVCTVHATALMATYHSMAGRRYTLDSAWCLMSLAAKLAQSVGLHRDGARWSLTPKVVQWRRSTFYELYCAEVFHSLALGRPPAIRLSYVDCEFPADSETTFDQDGKPLISYYQWKYEFCTEILSEVLELTLAAQPPRYETVLDLDRRVREKRVPPHLNVFMNVEDDNCTPANYMRGCMLGQYRAITLLFLHRSFFAQAMLDHPVNPLRSPYAPSFLAAYRCASGVIKSCINHFDRFPGLCTRWWGIWTHLFSAAIIVGTIVTRSPASTMAPNAFIELGLACDLFERGAAKSRRSQSGLVILSNLRNKAFEVYSQYRSGNLPLPTTLSVGGDYGDDELSLFGGRTKVVFSKLLSRRKPKLNHHSTSSEVASPAPSDGSDPKDHPASPAESLPDVHPSLVEYLSLLPANQHPHSSTTMNTGDEVITSFPSMMYSTPPPLEGTCYSPMMMDLSNNDTSMYGDFQSQNSGVSMFGAEAMNMPNSSAGPLLDLGIMMSADAGIDEQWKAFMRDSGLLHSGRTTGNLG
ncbi:hypothetical protein D9758_001145 [Tetrapyrgos nigripes]|uniref:Xylanolytic transcriptional activator regulatory domain-containing protein n=1 Tax=Tetrapyrgos nigripes TaxID=182062 RepID=A0A8H5GRT0_9AGAR|nr:hypothetical protein D9758_001145 [Tetrapyrgos nigripes]